jgi:hypothetical protein
MAVSQPQEFETTVPGEPSDDSSSGNSARFESLRKQAQLLVTGKQHDEDSLEYLLDCLREALSLARIWGTVLRPIDAGRIQRLRDVFALAKAGKSHERWENGNRSEFLQDLQDHASGFLAPLISELTVYWDSTLLKSGSVLVDLPGVGIAGDVYREVTQKWIREQARALVLVTNDRGIDDANANLLRSSGFLTRLLFSVDDRTSDPLVLAIAVTQLDRVAEARYAQSPNRKKREYLADAADEIIRLLRSQLKQQLEKAWSTDGERLTDGRQRVIDELAATVQVYPVSAWEYRRLLAEDDDDHAFIREERESGVPQLISGLAGVAEAWRNRAKEDLAEAIATFRNRALASITLIEASWQDDRRAADEAEQLRKDLEEVVAPLRREFDVRKGGFREFLRTGVPDKIDSLVTEAALVAQEDISKYLTGLETAHWATLKAAVVWGGAYHGARHINLPDDFAQRFVEPIAEVWGTRLLQDIRRRTKDFADDCVAQVEEVVRWCRQNGTRVQPKLLEAQVDAIKADAKQITLAGKELIADLRAEVKNTLAESIHDPIAERCREFVKKGDAMGAGVKKRILRLFAELSSTSTLDAKRVARRLLIKNFKKVEDEMRPLTAGFENPLDAAIGAIVESHEMRVRRSDAQRRRNVLDAARRAINECPPAPLAGEQSDGAYA